jgi:hypothetical protein
MNACKSIRVALPLALLTGLCACGKQSASPPPTETAPAQTAPLTQLTPEQLEAESSLSVKRGVITLSDAARRFRACGNNAETKLADQTDGLVDRVYGELGGKPLYVEAYGERADTGDFVLEEMLYATANGIEAACARPYLVGGNFSGCDGVKTNRRTDGNYVYRHRYSGCRRHRDLQSRCG